MNDWRNQVQRELADANFSRAEREEISREIANHLEDLYESARRDGLDDSAARARALAELHEDPRLGLHLRRARKENSMNFNERTKRLWLPGLTILLSSAACLAIFQTAGLRPYFQTVWFRGDSIISNSVYSYLTIYVPWLCVLPFFGAAGAYWSRRAGSRRPVQVVAGLFPVFVFLAIFLVVVPFRFAFEGLPGGNWYFGDVLAAVASWVLIPGAALFLGVLPFLCKRGAQQGTVAAN